MHNDVTPVTTYSWCYFILKMYFQLVWSWCCGLFVSTQFPIVFLFILLLEPAFTSFSYSKTILSMFHFIFVFFNFEYTQKKSFFFCSFFFFRLKILPMLQWIHINLLKAFLLYFYLLNETNCVWVGKKYVLL